MEQKYKYINQTKTQEFEEDEIDVLDYEEKVLTLYDDDYHSFKYVIEALIEICKHTPEQAEQCTHLVHFKGKCDVKVGTYEFLKPMQDAFISKDLRVNINP